MNFLQAQAKIQFQQTRQIILKLWEELEMDGAEVRFSEIASAKSEDTFVLSKANIQQLKEYLSTVRLYITKWENLYGFISRQNILKTDFQLIF